MPDHHTDDARPERPWSIVLGGGDSHSVRPLITKWLGHQKPKPFCTFLGTRSLWQHSIDRAIWVSRQERVIAVVNGEHRQEALDQLGDRAIDHLMVQPTKRGTAVGIFMALASVRSRDPNGTVVILPSDHFVYPESRFLLALEEAVWIAKELSHRLVLLGVPPESLELDYGWIKTGAQVILRTESPVKLVRAFVEKPTALEADRVLAEGALWSTLVIAAQVETLWDLGRQILPELVQTLEGLNVSAGGSSNPAMPSVLSDTLPSYDFSKDFLEQIPDYLAAVEMQDVLWSDWGRPLRIASTLRRIGREPAFPLHCFPEPLVPLQ
ncbi:MAG: sugar phosphate nucleotidyltransferase [Nitrospiraceae bacterium]